METGMTSKTEAEETTPPPETKTNEEIKQRCLKIRLRDYGYNIMTL